MILFFFAGLTLAFSLWSFFLPPETFQIYQDGFRDTSQVKLSAVGAGINDYNDAVTLQVYAYGAITVGGYLYVYEASHEHSYGDYGVENHDHADGTYAAASHDHSDGTYAALDHDHSDGTYAAADHDHADGTYDINSADINHISIGDGASEAGSVNATSVDIYLDFYNTGTSNWDNKHSVMATGVTIDSDVDITDGGTYPDVVGYWRIRIEPDSANADFVQGIVKIKHNLDN